MSKYSYTSKFLSFIIVFLLMITWFPVNGMANVENSHSNDIPTTGFEDSNGTEWTSHEDELAFLQEVEEKSERMTYSQVGSSENGLPLHLVKVGYPEPPSDEDIETGQNILIIGSQHGSEPAGREMALKMLRDLAFSDDSELVEQLENTTVMFIPTANPDGRKENRRTNEDGVDINRDHLHLLTSEVQALARVMNQYDPDIIVDAHERSSGPEPQMEVQWVRNLNVDVPLRELNEDMVNNHVRQDLENAGFSSGLYGGHDHYTLGLETVLSQMAGLRHSLGMLTESSLRLDPNVRVDAQMQTIETVLRFHRERSDEIRLARINAKEQKAIDGEEQSKPFYFDGADQRPPADESDILDPPTCGYLLNTVQANYFERYAELFSIETEVISEDRIFVSMAQPMMTVVPYLLDERAWHNVINARALDDCSDLESVDPPEAPPQSDPAQYQTDFSDDEIGEMPAGWSPFWLDSNWQVLDDPRRLEHRVTSTGGSNSKALVWDEVGEDGVIYGDVEIAGVVRADELSGGTLFQFGLHMSGEPGNENGYYVDLRSPDSSYANMIRINSRTNGAVNLHRSRVVPFTVETNTWYQVVLQREGRVLRAKVWPYGESEPSEFQVTYEANNFHQGKVGVFHFSSGVLNEWAFIGVGTGGKSAPRAPGDLFESPETLPAPENLKTTSITDTSVELAWDPLTNENITYDVYMDEELIGSTNESLYKVENLEPDTKYTFTIIARNEAGDESEPSKELTITTEINLSVINQLVSEYNSSGDLKGPLAKQLSNRLKQAEHHFEKGQNHQATKKMEDFLKHLNNKPMQRHVSPEAKEMLTEKTNALLAVWEEN